MELRLNSLGGYEPVIYQWPYLFKDQGCEIIEAISFACEEEPPLRKYLDEILTGCITNSYESMKVVCQRFNQAVDHLRSLVTSGLYEVRRGASVELLHHVIQTCYNRAVVDPEKLNHYEPFSAEVYGETSFELVHQMIETIKFTEQDQFIDLGSGVGHVVLQVAASTPCKSCYGIEKAHWPALYAKQMGAEFDKWMKFYGKECGPYDLLKGNFLSDDFKDVISNATVIFVNNFAFGPQIDHELKLRFSNLKEGTKIVSSKAFCAMNMQITERNLSDIGAILTVEELSPLRGPVSWTPKRVTYYLHTIDRKQLEEYFKLRQNPHKKQKKSLTSSGLKAIRNQEANDFIKNVKNTKVWRRKNGPVCKRPPTISMVSTITAIDNQTVSRSNIKKSLWNDSFNCSLSSHPAYIFPSAQALTFDESDALAASLQKNLNTNSLLDPASYTSPKKQYLLQSKTTPKMASEGRTPFSTPSVKDMLLGFGSDENDLSEELQLEIENIITLFHNETSKIIHQDAYKPSAIFNDMSLIENFPMMDEKKFEENNLFDVDVKQPQDFAVSLNSQIKHGDISNKADDFKGHSTPFIETPKITVSLPRFSPITPETPTNPFVNNRCIKKCIPFPCLEKMNDDLFVNTSTSGNVNSSCAFNECNQKTTSEQLPTNQIPSLNYEQKPVTLIPALHPVSCQQGMGDVDKVLTQCEEFSLSVLPTHQHNSPVPDKTQPTTSWDRSSSMTVSLPKQILDNSNRSMDESLLSTQGSGPCSNLSNFREDEDDNDPPELLHMMNLFKMQYTSFIKTMKLPSFKHKLIEDLNFEKSRQETLFRKVSMLKSELLQLQEQNRIMHQRFKKRSAEDIQFQVSQEESTSISSSPGLLDQAVCLDSTVISRDGSIAVSSKENFDSQLSDVIHNETLMEEQLPLSCNEVEFSQPPSPEMPLLLPETCTNFPDEQPNLHSKFTPPPQLTVCIDESKDRIIQVSISSTRSLCETTSNSVKKSPAHAICFSPISSCDTESPRGSPLPDGPDKNFKCLSDGLDEGLHPVFKNQFKDNMYYSFLSSSLQNATLTPCPNLLLKGTDIKFTCENVEPNFDIKKRKALDEAPDHMLKIKRLHFSNYFMNQVDDSAFDNMILRNVLNSKGLSGGSGIESRSDSRDSGFGKDSETDCEAVNRSKQPRNLKVPEAKFHKHYLACHEYYAPQASHQSLTMVDSILPGSHINLKENHCQVMAHGDMLRRDDNHQQVCHLSMPSLSQDGSCFSSGGQSSRPVGSLELSFSSLANYYEQYLSQDSGNSLHDNHKSNASNHFGLSRHTFSSAFT